LSREPFLAANAKAIRSQRQNSGKSFLYNYIDIRTPFGYFATSGKNMSQDDFLFANIEPQEEVLP